MERFDMLDSRVSGWIDGMTKGNDLYNYHEKTELYTEEDTLSYIKEICMEPGDEPYHYILKNYELVKKLFENNEPSFTYHIAKDKLTCNWRSDSDSDGECKCDKCEKMISYDDCVHYEEFVYLCEECGVDENGILYEDICSECYDRKCGCD
tara:strand:- start:649 stop:1101 length:453 start_codon:yes stop_codon:yes gene_type:complete